MFLQATFLKRVSSQPVVKPAMPGAPPDPTDPRLQTSTHLCSCAAQAGPRHLARSHPTFPRRHIAARCASEKPGPHFGAPTALARNGNAHTCRACRTQKGQTSQAHQWALAKLIAGASANPCAHERRSSSVGVDRRGRQPVHVSTALPDATPSAALSVDLLYWCAKLSFQTSWEQPWADVARFAKACHCRTTARKAPRRPALERFFARRRAGQVSGSARY